MCSRNTVTKKLFCEIAQMHKIFALINPVVIRHVSTLLTSDWCVAIRVLHLHTTKHSSTAPAHHKTFVHCTCTPQNISVLHLHTKKISVLHLHATKHSSTATAHHQTLVYCTCTPQNISVLHLHTTKHSCTAPAQQKNQCTAPARHKALEYCNCTPPNISVLHLYTTKH